MLLSLCWLPSMHACDGVDRLSFIVSRCCPCAGSRACMHAMGLTGCLSSCLAMPKGTRCDPSCPEQTLRLGMVTHREHIIEQDLRHRGADDIKHVCIGNPGVSTCITRNMANGRSEAQ